MAEVRSIGLKSLKIGAIAGDGGMGTSLALLGKTVADTCEFVQDDAEITEIMSEESDDPEEIIELKGKTNLKWSIIDMDPDTLVKILGGTVAAGPPQVWSAPITQPIIEQSIEIISKTDVKIQIVRARIYAKINAKLSKKGVIQVDITARLLTPTKAATAPYTVTNPS